MSLHFTVLQLCLIQMLLNKEGYNQPPRGRVSISTAPGPIDRRPLSRVNSRNCIGGIRQGFHRIAKFIKWVAFVWKTLGFPHESHRNTSSDGVKIHRCFFHALFVDTGSGAQVFVDRRMHGYFRIYGRLRETVLPGVRNGHRTEQKRPAAELLLGPVQMGV